MRVEDRAAVDTLIRPDAAHPLGLARRAVSGTPRRLMLVGTALAGLVAAFVLALSAGVSTARGEISGMSAKAAEVSATNDLYYLLNDMDAQVANALLVGFHPRPCPFPRRWTRPMTAGRRLTCTSMAEV